MLAQWMASAVVCGLSSSTNSRFELHKHLCMPKPVLNMDTIDETDTLRNLHTHNVSLRTYMDI